MNNKKRADVLAHVGPTAEGIKQNSAYVMYHTVSAPIRQDPVPPRHGVLRGEVWTKHVRGSTHALKNPPAWAVDIEDFDRATACGVRLLRIRDFQQGATFWVTLETFRAHAFAVNRGHGAQHGCELQYFRPTRDEADALAEADIPKSKVLQLGLFDDQEAA
ncbi:MAG: hypothetical protein ACYC5M_10705 [Anaerolineae bacterium]